MSTNSSPLGKEVEYASTYAPELLFPIPRAIKRQEIGIEENALPFKGFDVWNAYEISWLNANGMPQVCIGRFTFDATSPFIIESKSLKLYLNSFNNTKIDSPKKLQSLIEQDLSHKSKSQVKIELLDVEDSFHFFKYDDGLLLDKLDITMDIPSDVDSSYLKTSTIIAEEKLYSNLFKSNCLVTNQPDWASIYIEYKGAQIEHQGLLKYLISYRNHNGFHEQCVERVYFDIIKLCNPSDLTVFAKYTRRGGIDICPHRSSKIIENPRLERINRQ